jgi:hypothetical protein
MNDTPSKSSEDRSSPAAAARALVRDLADYRGRGRARRELLQLGADAVPALSEAVGHPLEGVRWSAMRTLADLKTPEALDALIDALKDDRTREEAGAMLAQATGIDLPPDPARWRTWRETGVRGEDPPSMDSDELGATDTSSMTPGEIIAVVTAGSQTTVEAEGDVYRLVIKLDRDRSQQVIVSFETVDEEGEPTVYTYTECGPAAPEQYDAVFRRNLTIPYGRIAVREIDGRDRFVMSHQMMRQGLNLAEMRKVIRSIAKEGDALELELTRQDVV